MVVPLLSPLTKAKTRKIDRQRETESRRKRDRETERYRKRRERERVKQVKLFIPANRSAIRTKRGASVNRRCLAQGLGGGCRLKAGPG